MGATQRKPDLSAEQAKNFAQIVPCCFSNRTLPPLSRPHTHIAGICVTEIQDSGHTQPTGRTYLLMEKVGQWAPTQQIFV